MQAITEYSLTDKWKTLQTIQKRERDNRLNIWYWDIARCVFHYICMDVWICGCVDMCVVLHDRIHTSICGCGVVNFGVNWISNFCRVCSSRICLHSQCLQKYILDTNFVNNLWHFQCLCFLCRCMGGQREYKYMFFKHGPNQTNRRKKHGSSSRVQPAMIKENLWHGTCAPIDM